MFLINFIRSLSDPPSMPQVEDVNVLWEEAKTIKEKDKVMKRVIYLIETHDMYFGDSNPWIDLKDDFDHRLAMFIWENKSQAKPGRLKWAMDYIKKYREDVLYGSLHGHEEGDQAVVVSRSGKETRY